MSFRVLPPLQQFHDNQGRPLKGGTIEFLDAGTTTPKSVFAEPALSTDLGSTLTLNAAGRLASAVWGSGGYRIRLYDADGALVDEADAVQGEAVAGTSIPAPAGHDGEFLSTDGVDLAWDTLREVPDPTGHNGKVLGTDGAALLWQAVAATPTLPEDGITQVVNKLTIGKTQILYGTATADASGSAPAAKAVNFATAFSATPRVLVTPTVTAVSPSGFLPAVGTTVTAAGFTAKFDNNSGYNESGEQISNAIPFDWIAIGPIA